MKLAFPNQQTVEGNAHRVTIPGWGWLDTRAHWAVDADGRGIHGLFQISEYSTGRTLLAVRGWASLHYAVRTVGLHLNRVGVAQVRTGLLECPKINP